MIEEKINKALEKCETSVRELISTAAQEGDYEGVERATDIAVHLRNLKQQKNGTGNTNTIASEPNSKPKSQSSAKSRKKTDYPYFQVKQDTLIRFGWSKKEKREYSHKIPKSAFDSVVAAISKIKMSGKGPHTADAIIELTNKITDEQVPSYQAYVVIGFLKEKGLIEQIGREGYVIVSNFDGLIAQSWK